MEIEEYEYLYRGACRCGGVQVEYFCRQPLQEQVARECLCSFCQPRHARYLSGPAAMLRVTPADARYLYNHVHGSCSADFVHCARCNSLVFARSAIEGCDYAVVEAGVLDDAAAIEHIEDVDYDGETLPQRLSRRADHWIPVLEIITDVAVVK